VTDVVATRGLLLIGGTSEIGLAIAERLAAEGPLRVYLLGRDGDRLAAAAHALGPGIEVHTGVADADDLDAHVEAVDAAFADLGIVDYVVLAVGVLGAQGGLQAERDEALEVMRVNFVGSGSLLLHALARLRHQGSGTLIVLSTVAAERPRASNAVYGAAKAGLDALAQGLADSIAGSGARVLVVRPGFVVSRMTVGLKPAPMATTPAAVAEATVQALHGAAHTVWVPGRLRLVFAILRHLPRRLYRRLPL
jgi:decaprenylphospho-beta-D-erythro-pentofuranosid-2-ulose 2-reductase